MRRGLPAVLQGNGSYIRSWLHADDTVDAIWTVIKKGERSTIYNAGANVELKNIDVVRRIAQILDIPESKAWIAIEDRSGQDVRYALDDRQLRALGWMPKRVFDSEIEGIDWRAPQRTWAPKLAG